jgi:hypothetical protein
MMSSSVTDGGARDFQWFEAEGAHGVEEVLHLFFGVLAFGANGRLVFGLGWSGGVTGWAGVGRKVGRG